jgi:hypothetical protein
MKALTFFLFSLLALAALGLSQFIIFAQPEDEAVGVALLIGVTGLMIGTFGGLIASSFASNLEKDRFHSRTTGLVGLILGYAIARLSSPVMERLSKVDDLFNIPATGHNALLFISTTLFGFIFGYVYRQYLPQPREMKQDAAAPAPPAAPVPDHRKSKSIEE